MKTDSQIKAEYAATAGRGMSELDLAAYKRLCRRLDIDIQEHSYAESKEKLIASFQIYAEALEDEAR